MQINIKLVGTITVIEMEMEGDVRGMPQQPPEEPSQQKNRQFVRSYQSH
jgi:hypothetical protein